VEIVWQRDADSQIETTYVSMDTARHDGSNGCVSSMRAVVASEQMVVAYVP